MAKKCRFRKKNGEICRANSQSDDGLCIFHDPARAGEVSRARRTGGKKRSQGATVLPPDTPDHTLGNSHDVARLLADTINQVRRGQLDPRVANTVGYLSNILVAALQLGPLEDRLLRLEGTVGIESADTRVAALLDGSGSDWPTPTGGPSEA